MLDDGNDTNQQNNDQRSGRSGNRTFIIVAGLLGVLIFLTLLAGVAYVLWIGPQLTAQRSSMQATIEAENAVIAQQMTLTAQAALWSPTPEDTFTPSPTPTVPSSTPTKTSTATLTPTTSPTPVLVVETSTVTPTAEPATLTALQVAAAQQAAATPTPSTTPASPTATLTNSGLPTTGFFDQARLPNLIALTLLLITVVFIVRRIRQMPSE